MEEKQFHGLSSAEVEDRIRMDRTNHMNTSASKSVSDIVKEHSLTYFNFLNLFLAVLVALTGQFKNMTFMGVILINTAIGIVQELKVKKLIDQISVMTAARTRVIREGVTKEIDVSDVVIDDVILLESGEQVCADCRLLDATGIEVNESMLTGESRPVKKQAGEELMSGSYLVSGSGVAKVFHVGENNYAATLAKKAKIKKRASSQMQEIIKKIIKIDGVLLIPVGILLYLSQRGIAETTSDAVVNTVAGVIGMIPEGLVLLTSVSFVLGVGRLARKKALVQEMEAIEALARVNVLCLDKTGTITTGKLDVVDVVPVQEEQSPEEITTIMSELTWAFDDVNSTQDALRKKFKKIGKWKAEEKIPFSSDRKYRAAFFEEHGGYALGAPEFLVPENTQLMERVNQYSAEGMRVLLLASATLKAEEMKLEEVKPLGLIIIEDQIRPEAKDTFAYFREQKVAIKVLSGDNPVTVSQIAGKAGLEGADKYLDARNLPEDFEELREVVEKYAVFGRVRPEQKQNIIKACQANGKVAGMVGDGVNDVLALKDADCGIAMAAGSDAAKQVAHIVLLDSNFASMTNIVGEGRTIISNIEKVSSLYLTKTIYSVLLCLIFIFWQKEYPFIPIQLSWISGVAIGVPSFLLTLEQNQNSISEGFLRHVMRVALPAALTMVGTLVLTEVLSPFWNGEDLLSSLYHLVLGGMVSLIVVYRVCMPMTRYHKVLCVGLTVIFAAGLVIAPGFLGIHRLDCWQSVLLIPMICMVCVLNQGLTHIFEWMDGKLKKAEK
ncbi:Calcium-transporting ATPase lmo0841 [uncultured Clostridium sp.]|uniref:HAD-IC family P-type ATPase n=1 Tax=Muricoprocola aceti TaxID=2981772 RepID=A0ABT2SIH9_9FIRM|nr:HAD-IC family P-type ATPase [Muricoprocola aceti]MCU6724095.1 HAD-IC family P-type ATPase [Muricoprocola aceti]SCG99250.1 Calcium-transporting ATPase lmo0841 [uncultured Clostridium sp.]